MHTGSNVKKTNRGVLLKYVGKKQNGDKSAQMKLKKITKKYKLINV